jgi:uncharacterized membrane protein
MDVGSLDKRPESEGGTNVSVRRIELRQPHPALVKHAQERAASIQNRIADRITSYAGSMNFVYLHIALFALWMTLLERKPWPTLTLVVSLEAIFLSTFVMISQNRADEKRQVIASAEWKSVQLEEKQNEQLLDLSQKILELTNEIHQLAAASTGQEGGPVRGQRTEGPPT